MGTCHPFPTHAPISGCHPSLKNVTLIAPCAAVSVVRTVVNTGGVGTSYGTSTSEPAPQAMLMGPQGVAAAGNGDVYFTETLGNVSRIEKR